jgi:cation diffusion facilitator CzcD-associated flavoprotein CzcO
MLQRSPSYVMSLPSVDPFADRLRAALPARIAHPVVRWKNVLVTMLLFQLSRRAPRLMKHLIRRGVMRALPRGYEVDTHFRPRYDPWDQRLCLVPDGDLFKAIHSGRASVVTDRIETFTPTGIRLVSGRELEADLVVTATGLDMLAIGGMQLAVDGRPVDVPSTVTYKGLMLSGVPNLATAIGYTNASWTLKCELICEYVCRLLNHMDEHGHAQCTPRPPDAAAPRLPLLELTSGYVQRSLAAFPRQSSASPWRTHQNYLRDVRMLRFGPVDDGMDFAAASVTAAGTGASQDSPERPLAA